MASGEVVVKKYPSGETYKGEVDAEGKRSGAGKCTWKDGTVFDGEWEDDCMVRRAAYEQ